MREETKERPQRQARYAVSIEYKMVRADIHRRPTSWNVRLCAIDDSPLCLHLVPLFFMAHPFISFMSLSSLPDPYPQKAPEIEERINNCPLRVHVGFIAQPSGDLREIKCQRAVPEVKCRRHENSIVAIAIPRYSAYGGYKSIFAARLLPHIFWRNKKVLTRARERKERDR